jgi:hypothetical protein
MKAEKGDIVRSGGHGYEAVLADVVRLIEAGRSAAARSMNAVMTATYWGIGRRIVEHEQGGRRRAEYGAALIERLADDLTARCGRGFDEVIARCDAVLLGTRPDQLSSTGTASRPRCGWSLPLELRPPVRCCPTSTPAQHSW